MPRFGSRTAVRAICLLVAMTATAACAGSGSGPGASGLGTSVPAGSSSGAASAAPAAAATPVSASSLPLAVTHSEVLGLFAYDSSKALEVKDVTPPKTTDGVTTRDITYASSNGSLVSAWLVMPSGSGPFAAVLFLHWLGQVNSNRNEFLSEATALAKRGVVSLLPTRLFPGVVEPTDWRTDRQSIADQTIELRRGLDVLLAQPGVDPNQLAFVGHDYGAMDGAVLAAVDHRLKAVVLMTPDATWANWFFGYFSLSPSDQPEYSQAMKEFDPVALLPDVVSKPLFLQFAEVDRFVSADVAGQLTAAAAGAKTTTYSGATHDLQNDATATTDREAWLAQQLGLPK